MKLVCLSPVTIYDEGLSGRYRAGEVPDGDFRLAELHPDFFRLVPDDGTPAAVPPEKLEKGRKRK